MSGKSDLTIPRRVTYEDYRHFPDDGLRYEILDGEIFMTPSPSTLHQFASKRLQRILEAYFEGPRNCLVLNAPMDVILGDADVVQPDLVVVARGAQVAVHGIEGAPLLVVEILSPSKPDYDRVTKARRYAAFNVPYYWIVDPAARSLECFQLADGAYRLTTSGSRSDIVDVATFDGLQVPLGGLWLDV